MLPFSFSVTWVFFYFSSKSFASVFSFCPYGHLMRKASVSVWPLWDAEPETRRWLELVYRKVISGSRREKAGTRRGGGKVAPENVMEIAALGKRAFTPQDHQEHAKHSLPSPPRSSAQAGDATCLPARPLAHWLPAAFG